MKRLFASLLILVLAASFSVAYVEQKYIGMDITAYNGTYSNFIIEAIKGVPTDAVGMPFYLTGADVAYNSTTSSTAGREIAQWSVHSNSTPIDIQITAEPLKLVDTNSSTGFDKYAEQINYVLFFPYTYTCYDAENAEAGTTTKEVSGFMRVESGEEGYSSLAAKNAISDALFDEQGVRAGINTGTFPVRFMLSSYATNNINNRDIYSAGNYRANVTIVNSGT